MLDKFDERERLFILVGLGVFIFTLLYVALIRIYKYRQTLSDKVAKSRSQYIQLDKNLKDYTYYSSLKTGRSEQATQIVAKLEQLLTRHSLKDRVSNMRDSKTLILKRYNKITIDINFRSVHLENVFKMIYDIEVNKHVNSRVEYLNLRKPYAEKETYDVNLKLSSYSKAGK